jgi:membrane protein DedA with SNARE-associated domain
MSDLVTLLEHHGYAVVFSVVLAEAIGLPVPAALALVAAGAAAASGTLSAPTALLLAIFAMLLGDLLLFELGRRMGWRLLGLLCRFSVAPETCILRSAESFYNRGKLSLLIAKFIPGVNTMAAPLAGSMKMRPEQFLRFDLAGAALYALAYGVLGFVFHDFLTVLTRSFQAAGRALEFTILVAILGYVMYRFWLFRKNSIYRVVPQIQVEELARKLASDEAARIAIRDVRSHGYYEVDALRIKGAIRLEPNNLSEELKALPREKDFYIYCT